MTNSTTPKMYVYLIDDPRLGRLRVDMEAFFEFSFELAEDLDDLVARWRPKAPASPHRHE